MNKNNLTLPQLLEAIELYFDCSLTDEQEKGLRHEIAMTTYSHPSIDEAKAIMGIQSAAISRKVSGHEHKQTYRKFTSRILPAMSIAASLALIITLGVLFARPVAKPATPSCVAYVNGKIVTDEEAVLALMAQNIDELHEGVSNANETLIDDLGLIAPVVDKYDTNFDPFEI